MKNYNIDLSVSKKYKSNYPIKVDNQSTEEIHKEVYKIAKYFKEELNYDTVTYYPYGDLREKYNMHYSLQKRLMIYLKMNPCHIVMNKKTCSKY